MSNSNEKLEAEIDAAVEDVVTETAALNEEATQDNVSEKIKDNKDDNPSDEEISEENDTANTDTSDDDGLSDEETETPDDDFGDDDSETADNIDDSDDKVSAISDSLVERAVKAGMTLADAQGASSGDSLERMVGLLENRQSDSGDDEVQDDQAGGEVDEYEKLVDSIPDLDEDEYSEDVVGVFSTMKTAMRGLLDKVNSLQSANSEIAANETTRWFDGQIADLGEQYESVLGKGSQSDVGKNSDYFANRGKVAEHMDVLTAGYESIGKAIPSKDVLFKAAVDYVCNDKIGRDNTNGKQQAVNRRSKQKINRSDNRTISRTKKTDLLEDVAAEIDAKFFS